MEALQFIHGFAAYSRYLTAWSVALSRRLSKGEKCSFRKHICLLKQLVWTSVIVSIIKQTNIYFEIRNSMVVNIITLLLFPSLLALSRFLFTSFLFHSVFCLSLSLWYISYFFLFLISLRCINQSFPFPLICCPLLLLHYFVNRQVI